MESGEKGGRARSRRYSEFCEAGFGFSAGFGPRRFFGALASAEGASGAAGGLGSPDPEAAGAFFDLGGPAGGFRPATGGRAVEGFAFGFVATGGAAGGAAAGGGVGTAGGCRRCSASRFSSCARVQRSRCPTRPRPSCCFRHEEEQK